MLVQVISNADFFRPVYGLSREASHNVFLCPQVRNTILHTDKCTHLCCCLQTLLLSADCFCTDICADITKPIVEESLSQKPAKFVIDENKIDVQIEGSLFDIKAICNASACTPDDHVTLVETLGHRSIRWGSAASFSLSILIVIFAIFAVLAMAAGCFLSRPKPKTTTEQEEFALFGGGQNLTSTNVNDVLEFNHIMMSIDLPPSAAKIYGQKRKKILKNISGSVESCCVMGIMVRLALENLIVVMSGLAIQWRGTVNLILCTYHISPPTGTKWIWKVEPSQYPSRG